MSINTYLQFVDYSSLGYGSRVGLFLKDNPSSVAVNPREEIGKLGISNHASGISRIFHKTIALAVNEFKTNKSKTIYLNKSSTIKWLNVQLDESEQVSWKHKDSEIISKLNNINKLAVPGKKICKLNLNNQNINSFLSKTTSIFCKSIISLTSSSWGLFKIRMKLLTSSESNLKNYSESLACSSFKSTLKHVKAYKDFVREQNCNKFSDIPITNKENYIKKYTQQEGFGERSLYVDSVIPTGSKKDTSTGTSGKPTSWYRGPQEITMINRSINFSAKAVLGDRPYYLINGFALGPWATGIAIANAAANDPNATVCNIGLDTNEIFQAVKDATKTVPKDYPIILAGYPPHLKEVVDLAVKEGFPLEEHNIIGIVGGESISESQRELIIAHKNPQTGDYRTGFKKCYSAYGASDLDVSIGYETDFAIELRQHLHQNPELAKELLGDSEFVPMIFPYDPLNYHIETDAEQNLIYTCVRGDRISPRVRYDLGDRGKTMAYSDVLAILKKYDINMQSSSRLPLPFLFVWGRVGTHVSLEGLKIAPENLDDALRSQGLFPQVQHYGFLQFEKDGSRGIKILIEMENDDQSEHEELHEKIINGLRQYNQEFNKLMSQGRPRPELKIYKKGTSPMAVQREMYAHRKKQYIFSSGDQFVQASEKSKCT